MNTVAVLAFSIGKRAQLLAIRITEQPILLTEGKINRPGYKFSKYFQNKRAFKSRSRPGPYVFDQINATLFALGQCFLF